MFIEISEINYSIICRSLSLKYFFGLFLCFKFPYCLYNNSTCCYYLCFLIICKNILCVYSPYSRGSENDGLSPDIESAQVQIKLRSVANLRCDCTVK